MQDETHLSWRSFSGSESGAGPRPVRCPEPLCPHQVFPRTAWRLATPSEGVTPPSSLLRTHAPDHNPLDGFGCPSSGESLQVVISPCWEVALPGVISANLSPHAWTSTPVFPLVHLPVSSQGTSAFTASGSARLSTTVRTATSVRVRIYGAIGSFTYVQACGCARHTGRSYRSVTQGDRE